MRKKTAVNNSGKILVRFPSRDKNLFFAKKKHEMYEGMYFLRKQNNLKKREDKEQRFQSILAEIESQIKMVRKYLKNKSPV